jgi:glucose-1-phosphate thymidylyltransferase
MWGVIPAAGRGSRIQPLAFSKELLPLSLRSADGVQRPCAVSELLMSRMLRGGADKICMVIGPGHGATFGPADLAYVVQPSPAGLCDAIFRVLPLLSADEHVLVGLPDTVWFPEDGFCALPRDGLSFLLFPVAQPQFFDAVLLDGDRVREIRVKSASPGSNLVWGAFGMPARILSELHALWLRRERRDEYLGTLINAWLAEGGVARGVAAGTAYIDVGTVHGWHDAMALLADGRRQAEGPGETGQPEDVSFPAARAASSAAAAAREVPP